MFKKLLLTLALVTGLSAEAPAQANIQRVGGTNTDKFDVTVPLAVPSGKSITINSGASIIAQPGATVSGFTGAQIGVLDAYGNLILSDVVKPTAPTAVLGASGSLTGTAVYQVSYLTAQGETPLSPNSSTITPSSQRVMVTLPVSTDSRVTARRLWRSKVGDTSRTYLVTQISDNTTTSYSDNTVDGSLGIESHYLFSVIGSAAPAIKVGSVTVFRDSGLNLSIANNAGISWTPSSFYNIGIGGGALRNNTLGEGNTAVGGGSQNSLISGSGNASFAEKSLFSATYADANTAIGGNAGFNVTGSYNTLTGNSSGDTLTTGEYNSLFGFHSGRTTSANITTGSYNTYIGVDTGGASSGVSNATALGEGAIAPASNTMMLGKSGVRVLVSGTGDNGGSALQVPGDILSRRSSGDNVMQLYAPAGVSKRMRLGNTSGTGGTLRWDFGSDGESEAGSNAGSNFFIARYADNGDFLGSPITISRNFGAVAIEGAASVGGVLTTFADVNWTGTGATGPVLRAPDGSKWRITVTNAGELGTVSVP